MNRNMDRNKVTKQRTRVKICCIASVEEAVMAVNAGADALGLVAEMPSGPGPIEDNLIREITPTVPVFVETFLLTSRTSAAGIIDHARYCTPTTVQIVSHIDPSEYPAIRAGLTQKLVQVIHVEDERALELIPEYEQHVDAFLLDSGRPSAATPELGGTGRAHDWSISEQFVARSSLPVFLAGGLAPSNAAEAINQVRPFGLDLCSGVRTDGKLDPDKLKAFMSSVGTTL